MLCGKKMNAQTVPSDTITIDVGGKIYKTTRTTILSRGPETMLGAFVRNARDETTVFFVDHDRYLFRWILVWYHTGVVAKSTEVGVSRQIWDATLGFYGIGVKRLELLPSTLQFLQFLAEHYTEANTFTFVENKGFIDGVPNFINNLDIKWVIANKKHIDAGLKQEYGLSTIEWYTDYIAINVRVSFCGFPACKAPPKCSYTRKYVSFEVGFPKKQ